jgi:pimeloyl-ACP methyl ester carboxylesterase
MSYSNSNRTLLPFQILKGAFYIGVAGVAALAAANAFISSKVPVLGPRLSGHFDRFPARFGDLAYVVAGTGSPVLLVHGIDPGRSMSEWRGVFDHLANNHTVYAFDFQGFGLSDTNADGYSAADFAEQISSFIANVIGKPTQVVAAGQGAIFAILAASQGANISKLTFISPQIPAFDAPSPESKAEALLLKAMSSQLLRTPIIGRSILNLWRSQSLLKKVAERSFFAKEEVSKEVKLWHTTAHQPGANFAQTAFLSNAFGFDWRSSWSSLTIPSLLIWGRQAQEYEGASEWLTLRPDARLEVVENAMLFPHLEQIESVSALLKSFLAET